MQEFKLGKQMLRILCILLIGLIPFYAAWENDELGLMQFFAHITYVLAVFILAIPILLIKNPIERHIKFFLIFMTVIFAFLIPFTNLGSIKESVKESILEKKVQKIEETFHLKLEEEDHFSIFTNHMILENKDKTLSIINKKGKEIERIRVTDIARQAADLLPLSEEEKENTYYMGYSVEGRTYLVSEGEMDTDILFQYITDEKPADFDDSIVPKEAKEVQYHYNFSFHVTLDEKGEIRYKKEWMDKGYTDFTYTDPQVEFIESSDKTLLTNLQEN